MPKVALVHDYFIQMGGAERVAEEMHKLFPTAPMFTTIDKRSELPAALRRASVHTSWMQNLPGAQKNFRHYFALYPLAVEGFDLKEYDLILSSSSGYAKGVRKRRGAIHICYCHTPMRWAWRYADYASREEFGIVKRAVLPPLLAGLRRWDLRAAQQPDFYIVNSHNVARRVKEIYGRESIVIPPPIDVNRFTPDEPDEDFYLILSRLVGYKQLDLAIAACRRMNRRLIVIGDGPDRKRLEKLAGKRTEFLGRQPDEIVTKYASRCRALLFPGEEDFGMVPLEINASGRPVIAYEAGGAMETVVDGITGMFFKEQTVESMTAAIEDFESRTWNRRTMRKHAENFDNEVFTGRISQFLNEVAPESCVQKILETNKHSSLNIQKARAV
ncbi:MAG: glycosyltransferase [Pyrinomonadaceae bacterium]|nr:glycosyltransferase [Pyrinomonadaceae bacterium]